MLNQPSYSVPIWWVVRRRVGWLLLLFVAETATGSGLRHRVRDLWRVLRRELASGFLLGLLLGTVGFFRSLLWHSGTKLSLVVALTLVAICTSANTIGALIPLVATRFRIDPAVVSAPLITTLVDATGSRHLPADRQSHPRALSEMSV